MEQVDFEKITSFFYNVQCFVRGEDPEKREQPTDFIDFAMYDEAERLFIPTYVILSSFLNHLDAFEEALPIFKPEFIDSYDPPEDGSKKDAREKFVEDNVILLEKLPDFCLVIGEIGTSSMPAEDERTSVLRLMLETKRIPLRLMFAAQVYPAIHHIMRQDTGRGYVTPSHATKLIESSINQKLDFHKNLRIPDWPPYSDGGFQDILGRIKDWVKTDLWEIAREYAVSNLCLRLLLLYLHVGRVALNQRSLIDS